MQLKVYAVTLLVISLMLLTNNADAGRIRRGKIKRLFKHSKVMQGHFTGFSLYDLDKKKMILELNDDKYFIPASNAKLLTWYTSLKMLGDSIPALKYVIHGDSLIFWGTGDPSFLHRSLRSTRALMLLKNAGKRLFFSADNYCGKVYGRGWAWDDYNEYYQAEITQLPLHDNVAIVYADESDSLRIKPAYLTKYLRRDSTYVPAEFHVKRSLSSNELVYPVMALPANFRQQLPWITSDKLTLSILEDTLKKHVSIISLPLPAKAQTIYDANADTVYRHMLQPSDNFIAEQLLLVCSSEKFNKLSTDSVINYSKHYLLNDLPDIPQWIDGSGLSRYNLLTPRSIVVLLCKILEQLNNEDLVHSMLPAGGVTGTIKDAYRTEGRQPFIWAKTGSLSNDYNESGYMVTHKGKRLAFSFMNNNFIEPTSVIRDEVIRMITYIHDEF